MPMPATPPESRSDRVPSSTAAPVDPPPEPDDLPAFWDARRDAVRRWGRVAAGLPATSRQAWLDRQGLRVLDGITAMPDPRRAALGLFLAEALYQTVTRLTAPPDPASLLWLEATAAPALALLAEQGLRLSLVIENAFGPALGGPLTVFPDWFRAAGLAYVCPHHLVWDHLVGRNGHGPDEVLARLPDLLPNAWALVPDLIADLRRANQPLVMLDPTGRAARPDEDPQVPGHGGNPALWHPLSPAGRPMPAMAGDQATEGAGVIPPPPGPFPTDGTPGQEALAAALHQDGTSLIVHRVDPPGPGSRARLCLPPRLLETGRPAP